MADKKTEIETTAIAAIKRGGLASVSFRTLADAVGVKSASVHYHFPTKGDLSQAVVQRYTEEFAERLREIRRESTGAGERLGRFADLFQPSLGDTDVEVCLCGMLSAEVENLDEGTRRALGAFFEVAEAWLASVLDDAAIAGAGIDAQAQARMIMAGLEGAALIDRVERRSGHLDAWRSYVASLTGTQD